MTKKELVSAIAKQEGKRHQASVGDVREVISLLEQLDKNTGGLVIECLQRGAAKKKVQKI